MHIARILVIAVTSASLASPARADDKSDADAELAALPKPADPDARGRFSAGNKHYRLREFEAALAEYKASALKDDAAVLLYNLGQCYRAMHRYEDANWHYRMFLSRIAAGTALRKRVDGFIAEGARNSAQEPLAPAPDKPTPAEVSAQRPIPATSPGAVLPLEPERWYRDPLGWSLTGVGAVSVGAGIWLLADAAGIDDDANTEPMQPARKSLHDKASVRRVEGAAVGIAGIAALTAGVLRLISTPHNERRSAAAFHVVPTTNGIAVLGSF